MAIIVWMLHLSGAAVGSRTKAVLICNPNNPTGTALAPDALDGVLDAMPTDILIILDEAYCDYDGSAEAVAASLNSGSRDIRIW